MTAINLDSPQEVQIEIGLPDAEGRLQILKIKTAEMRENNMMSSDIDLEAIALRAKNFSGAEIVVRIIHSPTHKE
jgi:vesicle-fusing ATPase